MTLRRLAIPVAVALSLALTPACASDDTRASTPASGGQIASEGGVGAGSALASIVYAPVKLVYATGGLIAGGLAWVASGGDDDVAMQIIRPAVTGDYVISSEQLRDPSKLRFVGSRHVPEPESAETLVAAMDDASGSGPPAVSAPPPRSVVSSAAARELMTGPCEGDVALPPIHFQPGQAVLDDDGRRRLRDVPMALIRCPGSRVRIAGHTDATGAEAFNLALSHQRAAAIRDYLLSQGIEASRLDVLAQGEDHPVSSNDTPEGRAANRRGEVAVLMR